jgi:hypothetical protein
LNKLVSKSLGYCLAKGGVIREVVNAFIRITKVIDGFIDFDEVIRNLAKPTSMMPAYDSGDH